ncbi:hypothetical protein HBI44_110570 [Parastagonospora nodorum]|nr:hypothetical protein HBI44_110570 [Parastagonospora nodorum]
MKKRKPELEMSRGETETRTLPNKNLGIICSILGAFSLITVFQQLRSKIVQELLRLPFTPLLLYRPLLLPNHLLPLLNLLFALLPNPIRLLPLFLQIPNLLLPLLLIFGEVHEPDSVDEKARELELDMSFALERFFGFAPYRWASLDDMA